MTHADVPRYFITTSEAVQFVLQASILPEARVRIAMLGMGEPVKMLDLAENMIRLVGLRLNRDIQIRLTGLRPGEKLHEELADLNENTLATGVEKVPTIDGPGLHETAEQVLERMRRLEQSSLDGELRGGFLEGFAAQAEPWLLDASR